MRTAIAVGVATGWLPPDEFEALVPILVDFCVAESIRLNPDGDGKIGPDHLFSQAKSPFTRPNAALQERQTTWLSSPEAQQVHRNTTPSDQTRDASPRRC